MAKEIRIRLYRIQDFDLYALFYDKKFSLSKIMHDAVCAYAEQKEAPVVDVSDIKPFPNGKPICITTSFVLKDNETRAIEMLEAISSNKRNANNFVKNLVRRSLTGLEGIYFKKEDKKRFADGFIPKNKEIKKVQEAIKKPKKTESYEVDNQEEDLLGSLIQEF